VGPASASRDRSRPQPANLLGTEDRAARRGADRGGDDRHVPTSTCSTSDRQLKISEDTLKVRQASVKIFRMRFEGGTISDFEMQQVQAEYEIAVAAIPQAKRLIAVQEDALSFLLGRNPGPIARASVAGRTELPPVPSGLPADLLERRPDIQQAEQQLAAANARIGVARALYYPRIS
jgi:multidrug efflux system outer membrane protein